MKDFELEEIWVNVKKAKYGWISISLVLAILSHLSRAIRWKLLIGSMGYKVSTRISFWAVMIGYLSNLAFPRMGEVARCGMINRYNKVPVNKLIGTVFLERGIDLIMLLIIIIATFFIQADLVAELIGNKLAGYSNISVGTIILLVSILIVLIVLTFILRVYINQTSIYQKVKELFLGFWEGVLSVKKLEKKAPFFFHTFFIWIMYFFMTYICFFGFEPTSSLGVGAGLTTLTFGSIGMAAPVQGGIGTYHILVQKALLVYGVDGVEAISFAWIIYAAQILLVIVVGAVAFIALSFEKREEQIIL